MRRHVILIGLPGAGKTTVGRLVADEIGAPFVDLDALIVRHMQMPVARIFGEYGEGRFRDLEREAMTQALAGEPSIISPGGGWAAQPGEMERAEAQALVVYLKCMAMTAARRIEDTEARPLLGAGDPVERLRVLLQEREPFYLLAAQQVKNDSRTAQVVAQDVVALARAHAGW